MPDLFNTTYKNFVDNHPPYSLLVEGINQTKVDRAFWKTSMGSRKSGQGNFIIDVTYDAVFEGPKFPNPNRRGKYRCLLTKITEYSDDPNRIVETGKGRWGD